jgi:SDR family mycofactocin-dependent oxidoreductase
MGTGLLAGVERHRGSGPMTDGPVSDGPVSDAPVAVITGAARGLGAATARQLAADGYRLVLLDGPGEPAVQDADTFPVSTAADLAGLANELPTAIAVPGDVRVQADVDRAVDTAMSEFGRLDAAVAVAGAIAGGEPAWLIPDASWTGLFGTNVDGVLHLIRAAVPQLLTAPAGRFVAVSSAAGTRPLPKLAAYSASKHAVVGLVRSLAADLTGTMVTANVVCPGSMRTSMLDASAAVYQLDSVEEFTEHALIKRLLDPAEVAAMIGFLCGPQGAGITDAVIPVDGGFTG